MELVACERFSYPPSVPCPLPPASSPWGLRFPTSAMDVFLAMGVEVKCMHFEAKIFRIFTFVLFPGPLLCTESGTSKTGEPSSAWGPDEGQKMNFVLYH